jgi:hypothetical protein
MKRILFIAILAIISSAPAYPAADGNSAGNSAGYGSGGPQTGVIPPHASSNNAVTPRRHHKRVQWGAPAVVEDIPTTEVPHRRHRHSGVVQQGGGLG